MECTLHLECTWSGVGVCFYWWVIWLSPWSGILVYAYGIRSVVGVYTPVGVATEWLWSVHSVRVRVGSSGVISRSHITASDWLVWYLDSVHINKWHHIFNKIQIKQNSANNTWKTNPAKQPAHISPKQIDCEKSPKRYLIFSKSVYTTVCPKKYAHGFVVLCFVVVMQSFIMNSHEVFIHIHQGCFAGTGAIVRLPQCQWSKPDGYGKISQCITTTKHSKAKTVCIFLGIYCTYLARRCARGWQAFIFFQWY